MPRKGNLLHVSMHPVSVNKLYLSSKYYKEWHKEADSDDGRTRLNYSVGFEELSKMAYSSFHKATKFIGDKNQGMEDIINARTETLDTLRQRQPQPIEANNQNDLNNQKEANVQNEAQKQVVHHGPRKVCN